LNIGTQNIQSHINFCQNKHKHTIRTGATALCRVIDRIHARGRGTVRNGAHRLPSTARAESAGVWLVSCALVESVTVPGTGCRSKKKLLCYNYSND